MTPPGRCETYNGIDKNDPTHLSDLHTVLLEENWCVVPSSTSTIDNHMTFRKNGSEYDNIVVKGMDHGHSFWVTIPLPSTPGAFRTRVDTAMDVYLYVTTFIEYYAEVTLDMQHKHNSQ